MKMEIARQLFVKLPNIKVYKHPLSRFRVVTCLPTDGRAERI